MPEEGEPTMNTTSGDCQMTQVDEAILNAARASFIANGFRKTSIAAIARDAGVSRPTVYARVENMEEAVSCVLRIEGMRVLAAAPMAATTLEDIVEAAQILEGQLRSNELYAALMESDPKLFTFQMFDNPARPQQLATRRMAQLIQQVQQLQQQAGPKEGERRIRKDDPEMLAIMVIYMLQTNAFAAGAVSSLIGNDRIAQEEFATQIRNYLTAM